MQYGQHYRNSAPERYTPIRDVCGMCGAFAPARPLTIQSKRFLPHRKGRGRIIS
jgi:hypothetical protein